jgi:deoxycytidine triphosphate deaminase
MNRRRRESRDGGGILARSAILERLETGEIFAPDTWTESQLGNAAYEVRLAGDLMFIPGPTGEHVKYNVGEYHPDAIILKEGEVALVSTVERFRLPADIGAYIGTKWSLVRRGLLVLTGSFVNPRFGLQLVGNSWEPKPDERLHFLIVNLGSEPQAISPGITSLVSLQFHRVLGDPGTDATPSTQRLIADDYEPNAPAAALSLFPELKRQREAIEELRVGVEKIENGFSPLITFGVYLLAVTFLGVVLNSSLQLATDHRVAALARDIPHNWPFTLVAVSAIAGIALVIKKIVDALVAVLTAATTAFGNRRRPR